MSVTEYRMGKPRTIKDKPLKQPRANDPVELTMKLSRADTAQAKRELVTTAMGELFYAFGEKRRSWKAWLSYEENINMMYLGGRVPHVPLELKNQISKLLIERKLT